MKPVCKRAAALILVLAMLCSLLTGCGGNTGPRPEDTVAALEQAVNSADTEGLLDCFSSSLSDRVRPLLKLTFGEEGLCAADLLNLLRTVLPMIPILSGGTIEADDLPRLRLTAGQAEIGDDRAEVAVTGELLCGDHSTSFSGLLRMRLEDGRWVITGIA